MSKYRITTCAGCGAEHGILYGNKVRCPCGTTYGVTDNGESYIVSQRPKPKNQVVGTRFPPYPEFLRNHPEFLRNPPEGSMVTRHPRRKPLSMVECMAETIEATRQMFNYTSPNEKTVTYSIEERDGIFVIFSKAFPIHKDGTGSAINFVAEKENMEAALDLIARLKKL